MELQVILLVEKQDLAVSAINNSSPWPWELLRIGVHENLKSSGKNESSIINFEVQFIKKLML